MENFKTIYNEKKNINNLKNSWNYYFENVSNYSLDEVYKSNKVIIVSDKFFHHFNYNMEDEIFKKAIMQKIKIKEKFLKISNKIIKKDLVKKL